jgi:hypothetical protein
VAVDHLVLVRRMRPRRYIATFLLLATLVGFAHAGELPISASVPQLLATPQKFSGKRVSVVGYYVASLEHSGLYSQARAAEKSNTTDDNIWLDPDIWSDPAHLKPGISPVKALNHRLVHVVGTFEYKKMTQRKLRDEGQRTIFEATVGFGWGGLWPSRITKISELRPEHVR